MENPFTTLENLITGLFAGMSDLAALLVALFAVILGLLIIYFFRIHIAYRMAKNRHRDPLGWALLSFFVSPILTWIILLFAGDARS